LILHGAAGHAAEWRSTAAWLSELGCVLAADLRGHGESELRPASVDLDAFVRDARVVVAAFKEPLIVIGQSLGGSIALALAARAPAPIRALVIVEASPSQDPNAARAVRGWLNSWPVPFPSREAAEAFFGGGGAGAAWADGLAETAAGFVPRFDADVVEAAVRSVTTVDLWADWRHVGCSVLVVRGSGGDLSDGEGRRMAEANSKARVAVVTDAGHDVHLDNPVGFRTAVESFMADVLA
jgi:pimeloyl-ACP methyl ester carboxylesterase